MAGDEHVNHDAPNNRVGDEAAPVMNCAKTDQRAAHDLLPLVYAELRRLAAARLAALRPGQTLQPTALVHEAYLRLVKEGDPGWNGRAHFFGAAARAMRNILVDHARRRSRLRHGGDWSRVPLDDLVRDHDNECERTLHLDRLISELEAIDTRKADIVTLHVFVGMTHEMIAESLGISLRTVEREWRFARAWLRSMQERDHDQSE